MIVIQIQPKTFAHGYTTYSHKIIFKFIIYKFITKNNKLKTMGDLVVVY